MMFWKQNLFVAGNEIPYSVCESIFLVNLFFYSKFFVEIADGWDLIRAYGAYTFKNYEIYLALFANTACRILFDKEEV